MFLRVYRISDLTTWEGDQGSDLLVAQHILHGHLHMLVGPPLNVTNFYTPPTYYYLLALFLLIVKTPLNVALLFTGLNVAAGVFIFLLIEGLFDFATGLFSLVLFSISSIMIINARSVYQPYPVILFIAASWYFLWDAYRKNNLKILVLSNSLFIVGASIYPAPWLLLPYFAVKSMQLLRRESRNTKNWLVVVFADAVVGLIIYLPQIIFEVSHKYPMTRVLFRSVFGIPHGLSFISNYGVYSEQIILQFFNLDSALSPHQTPFVTIALMSLFILMVILSYRAIRSLPPSLRRKHQTIWSFINPLLLCVCIVPVICYWENAFHRLNIYYPLLLIIFVACVNIAHINHSQLLRYVVIFLLCVYCFGALASYYTVLTSNTVSEYTETEVLSNAILRDAKRRKLHNSFEIFYYTPYGYGDYNAPAIFYFLEQNSSYHPQFLSPYWADTSTVNIATTAGAYLVCRYYENVRDMLSRCRDMFIQWNPKYRVTEEQIFPLEQLFILTKNG